MTLPINKTKKAKKPTQRKRLEREKIEFKQLPASETVTSWRLLDKIASTHTNSNLGWLVDGYFNEILFDHEKKRRNSSSLLGYQ